VTSDTARSDTFAALLRRAQRTLDARVTSSPAAGPPTHSIHSFGAHFVELSVDPDVFEIRVRRMVSAYGVGRVVNPRTAHSQAVGGMIGGVGMALLEHTDRDLRLGRHMNANLSEYLIAVHADIPVLEPFYLEEVDPHIGPLGAKGLGELPIVGVAAAISNAVYHATGTRIRELPITLDKLLQAQA